jgi:uncharacterized protein
MTPDVNVLVAAFRGDHPHHAAAIEWLRAALSSASAGVTLTLMPMVLASFLRLVTNPRVFLPPAPIDQALVFVDVLLDAPGVQLAKLGPEWPQLRQLCKDKQLSGNALPDAWLAAAAMHLGQQLVSFDKDFRKLLGRSQFILLSAA